MRQPDPTLSRAARLEYLQPQRSHVVVVRCLIRLRVGEPLDEHRSTFAGFDAVLARRIDHRYQAYDAPIALGPTPGKSRKSDALARHSIELASDVLESADARG